MNLRMRVLTFTALGLVAMFVFSLRADEPAKGNLTQQASPAPDEALRRLKEGNARFVADMPNMAEPASKKRIQLSGGQRPIAVVLTCAGPSRIYQHQQNNQATFTGSRGPRRRRGG